MCAAHHRDTSCEGGLWSVQGPPRYYPDAVTLREGLDPGRVTARVPHEGTVTVKDSFDDLDLEPDGWQRLFGAQWIHRPPARQVAWPDGWARMIDDAQLARWQAAHGDASQLVAGLLADPHTTFYARLEPGHPMGFVAHRDAEAVGIADVFSHETDAARVWPQLAAVLDADQPGLAQVGYESGADLEAATAAGFAAVGPLTVWIREPH